MPPSKQKHQRRPIRENVTVGSCLSWPRLSKTVVETNTEMPLPQRNPRKAVTGKGLPCPGFDERGCTWPGATCKYKEFRNGHERYHPKCTRCMKRAANPSHGQSSPQSEPQDHDAARPSSFETSESAPERPQNVNDLGAGGFVTRPVPPRGRPPIDDNGNRMRWSGRDESYAASAGDLRAMSRLATSRAGSAHYGRVKTSWLVDFPWLDVRFVLRDSITGRCSSRREGEAPCPGCVLCCRLFCKLCGHSSSTVFGGKSRGCKTIKRQALLLHNQLHPPTLENFRRIPKMLSEQDAYNHRRHMRLLFAVYHLATTHQALRRMPTMAKLAIQWNFRDKDGVREDLGRAYVGPDGARVFLFCIADVLLGYINELACKSPVIGIAIDESTDHSGKKVLLIYVRLRCADGVFRTFYWAALYVKQADAESLYKLLEEHFEACDVKRRRRTKRRTARTMRSRMAGKSCKRAMRKPF